MGRLVLTRAELNGSLSEIVGYKAGLALDVDQMAKHVDEDYAGLLRDGPPDDLVTIRAEEAEEVVSQLLHGVGNLPTRRRIFSPGLELYSQLKGTEGEAVYMRFTEIMRACFEEQKDSGGPFDFTPVLIRAEKELGASGAAIALAFYELTEASLQQNPWSSIRRVEWADVAALNDLFSNESLATPHGAYLDQRFIDYLDQNGLAIDAMHWRKFEGLAGEFFSREGYRVEMGDGRDDGGVDLRVWAADGATGGPPTMIVQCKRQKAKVGKVVVKALWADVVDEGAKSGLIVTTSALEPGAERVRVARAYAVEVADRAAIRTWVRAMRTPNAGVFMGY